MRARTATLSVAVWLAAASAPAGATDAARPETIALAKSFAKICLLELPNFESVILRAKIEGWKQIEGPAREPILHPDSKPTTSSWMTRGVDDLRVAVTVARRNDQTIRRQVWTCAVQNPEVSPNGLAPTLVDLLSLPDATPETVNGQLLTKWDIRYGAQLVDIVSVIDAAGKPGVILNAIQLRGIPD